MFIRSSYIFEFVFKLAFWWWVSWCFIICLFVLCRLRLRSWKQNYSRRDAAIHNRKLFHYYERLSGGVRPADRVRLVTLCHATRVGVRGDQSMSWNYGNRRFSTRCRFSKLTDSEEITPHAPNQETPLCHVVSRSCHVLVTLCHAPVIKEFPNKMSKGFPNKMFIKGFPNNCIVITIDVIFSVFIFGTIGQFSILFTLKNSSVCFWRSLS